MACVDTYHRPIEYLRISVTDRCNLRCLYCMPKEGVPWRSHDDILSFEEIETVVRAATGLGIEKIRLTGGEPLARLAIVDLVRSLARIPGVTELSMTTNGVLLPRYAAPLAEAGLRRVNISLDTLRSERFNRITRVGHLEDALAGIDAAHAAGLEPVKINMVVIRGLNDDEVVTMARRSVAPGWHVRFIEWMPVGDQMANTNRWSQEVVTVDEIRERIEKEMGPLEPTHLEHGSGPAQYFRVLGAPGTLGFISPISHHFCQRCNRLRLTADGLLLPCLLSDLEVDLKGSLRSGAGVREIEDLLRQTIEIKPLRHHLEENQSSHRRVMSQIGG